MASSRARSTGDRQNEGALPAGLPRTAREVLDAAKRIVAERGLEALTLDAVAEESGNYRSAIRYHFGDKAGLVAAVMDSTALTPDTTSLFASVMDAGQGPERIEAHLAALERVSSDRDQYRLFWSLLPHILNDPELRRRLDGLYDGYRGINTESLGVEAGTPEDERRLMGLASLLTAVCDGLGLLACLGDASGTGGGVRARPQSEFVDAAYEALGEMLEAYLPKLDSRQREESR